MELQLQQVQQTMIVKIAGELDHHYAAKIREVIDAKIRELDIRNLVFDMSSIVFMDSSGIGVILGRYKLIKRIGGVVYLAGINKKIGKIIEMSGLQSVIKTVPEIDLALNELKNTISQDLQSFNEHKKIIHEIYV